MYPECQEKVFEEIKKNNLADDGDISIEQLANLKYMDMFIKETLRLFPVAPYLTRMTIDELKLGKLKTKSVLCYIVNLI